MKAMIFVDGIQEPKLEAASSDENPPEVGYALTKPKPGGVQISPSREVFAVA